MIKWLLPLTITGLAFAYFRLRSDYVWQLALLAGLSIGALSYVVRNTVDQMVGLFSSEESRAESGFSGEGT